MPSGSAATSPDWSAASVYVLNGSTTAPSLRKTTRNSIVIGLGFFSSLGFFLNNPMLLLPSLLDMMSPLRSSARKLAPMDMRGRPQSVNGDQWRFGEHFLYHLQLNVQKGGGQRRMSEIATELKKESPSSGPSPYPRALACLRPNAR